MQSVTDMALPVLPLEDPAFTADPTARLEAARAEHPWLARCDSGLVVHGYQAAKDLMLMDDKMGPAYDLLVAVYGAEDNDWARFMTKQVANRVGPEHSRLRGSVAHAFTPRNANRYRETMRQVVSDLLDEWLPKGRFDFAEFASYFPVAIMCRLLGTPDDEIPRVRDSLETQAAVLSLDPGLLPDLLAGYEVLWDYVDRLIKDREARGPSGESRLLDELLAVRDAGGMNDVELRDMLMVLFVAGYDTSKNMIALMMYRMLDHPEHWARCAEDKAFCVRTVEELLRDFAIACTYRSVNEEFSYDGVFFPKGTLLIINIPLSGRDPTMFDDPANIHPERANASRHLGFGRGVHMCLGQHLARAQIEEGVHIIAQRIPKPKLAGELKWRPAIGITGLLSFPIEVEPASETIAA
jgi:cytochrome P450